MAQALVDLQLQVQLKVEAAEPPAAWPLLKAEGMRDMIPGKIPGKIPGQQRRTAAAASKSSSSAISLPSSGSESGKRPSALLRNGKISDEKRRKSAVLLRTLKNRGDRGSGREKKRSGGALR